MLTGLAAGVCFVWAGPCRGSGEHRGMDSGGAEIKHEEDDSMTMLPAAPGDVLAVAGNGPWIAQKAIELGEWLNGFRGGADQVDHVVVITHQDQAGRWIGIQGKPGGVGLVDCTPWLRAKATRSNFWQPKPTEGSPEMNAFLASCAKSLGTGYDWVGITEDGFDALHLHNLAGLIDPLWRWPSKGNLVPGHVVCSSLAAALYEAYGWPHPDLGSERRCEPSAWWNWNDRSQWLAAV